MDLTLKCDKVNCSKEDRYDMNVEVINVAENDVLDHFKVKDIVDHFGPEAFLDHIGKERVKEYFDLVTKE